MTLVLRCALKVPNTYGIGLTVSAEGNESLWRCLAVVESVWGLPDSVSLQRRVSLALF